MQNNTTNKTSDFFIFIINLSFRIFFSSVNGNFPTNSLYHTNLFYVNITFNFLNFFNKYRLLSENGCKKISRGVFAAGIPLYP